MSVNNISFILHKPQLSENIGACARGMKNFGFSKLALVDPKPSFPNDKIFALSVGAKDIIKKSKIYKNLEQAVEDIDIIVATSARYRNKNVTHIELKDLKKINYKKNFVFECLRGNNPISTMKYNINFINFFIKEFKL